MGGTQSSHVSDVIQTKPSQLLSSLAISSVLTSNTIPLIAFVLCRFPSPKAELEINKEALLADLVCLLDVDLPEHKTAEFKKEIEKFFIDGGTRIDLIAQVMELDNNIGTYNYDIANLRETQKQIKAVNKAKGKNFLLKETISSSYKPSESSVWENLDRGRQYRPNAVRSVPTTEVKILPYRPT